MDSLAIIGDLDVAYVMIHKKRVNGLLLAAMLLFQVACSSVQITREASAPVKPTWISAPPQKAGMMYFVGIATGAETLEQGKEAAMRNATSQIAHLMGSKVESRFEQSLAARKREAKQKVVIADPRRESSSEAYLTETEQQEIKWKITAISQAIVRGEYVVGSYHEKLIRAEKNIRLEKYDVYVLVEIPAAKVDAEITIQRHENERTARAAYDLYLQGKLQAERRSYAEARRLFGQALTMLNGVGDVVVLPGKTISSQQLLELLKEEKQKADARLMSVSLVVRADSAFYSSLSSTLIAKGYVITNENPTFEITGVVGLTEGWGALGSPVFYAEGNLSAVRRSDGSVIATVAVNGKGIHQNRRQAALDALSEAADNAGASLAEMLIRGK